MAGGHMFDHCAMLMECEQAGAGMEMSSRIEKQMLEMA